MGDRTFRYEIVRLDTGFFPSIKLFFTGKATLICLGKYFSEAKARKHLDLLRSGKNFGTYIYDTKTESII